MKTIHRRRSKNSINEYSGQTINSWTILSYSHPDKHQQQCWNVRCKCGALSKVRATQIIKNRSKGCCKCGKLSMIKHHWKGGEFISASIHTTYRQSAKKRNIPFKITIEQLEDKWREQNGLCAYSGKILTLPKHNRDFNYNASIDRIDSKLPYEKSNIEWVTKTINFMKQSLSKKEFIETCKLITNHTQPYY